MPIFSVFTKNIFLTTLFSVILFSCSNNKCTEKKCYEERNKFLKDVEIPRHNDTTLTLKYDCCFYVTTEIFYPPDSQQIKGSIFMLHGWNLPALEWCEKTDFCSKALDKGYVLIIPNYSKSNYALEIYPETRPDYIKYPTLTWIMEIHIPYLQEVMDLLLVGQNTHVAGISTGARGATLLGYYMPQIFKSVASLSGDFDITSMQNEYLYYAFFGQYKNFPERWKKECFAYDVKNYKLPTYIGHGKADKVSPVEQSMAMYDSIVKNHPDLKVIGNFPENAQHNYDYWKSETDNILKFFDECSEKGASYK